MNGLGKRSRLSETSDDDSEGNDYYHTAAKRVRSAFSAVSSFSGTGDEDQDQDQDQDQDAVNTDDGDTGDVVESRISANPAALGMMKKMGYQEGRGLGKHNQGIREPIEASTQKGRRGLGLSIPQLDVATSTFDPSAEKVSVKEDVSWLKNDCGTSLSVADLDEWMTIGPKKLTIDDEDKFCDSNILRNVLSAKSVFDRLGPEEVRKARTRSNPFELIRGVFFLNRAAMKMANMDRVFDFMFTQPKTMDGRDALASNELLYFADVCAGPGGFSEYVLYRKRWRAKGFGFTLKNENDFRLSDFFAAPSQTFEPYYGVKDNGDIFDPANIESFTDYVLESTEGKGVHFMMADGGFSVEGQENIQEILSKQLYLCQCLVALRIVRTYGHFVVKLFDLFTPFSAGLVYLMYRSFHQISIHKPNTSRPANSERYLICKFKRGDCMEIAEHLFNVNVKLFTMPSTSDDDVTSLVPYDILNEDPDFYEYLVGSNNSLGERQAIGLTKIAAYCDDTDKVETRQKELRTECLKYWEIPDKARTQPPNERAAEKGRELLEKALIKGFPSEQCTVLTPSNLKKFESIYDWYFSVLNVESLGSKSAAFYLATTKNLFRLENGKWKKTDLEVSLTPDTLIYAEEVPEYRGIGRGQLRNTVFHVIDGLILGGESIHHYHITERVKQCNLFVKALQKKDRKIRMKELHEMQSLPALFPQLEEKSLKNGRDCFGLTLENETFYVPGGLLFFNGTKPPWQRHYSRSWKKIYYDKNKQTSWDHGEGRSANFKDCFEKRLLWRWDDGVIVHENQNRQDTNKLQAVQITNLVEDQVKKTQG